MSASPIPDSPCLECGEELAPGARFCSSCGTPVGALPAVETVPGPVVRESVEQRWLGMPARFVLLCLGFAAFGAAIGLFATGSWAWGIVLLLLAIVLLAALGEATRRSADAWMQHSSRLAADGPAQAATTVEVWRTRLETALNRWRTRSRLDAISVERGPALQALGDAVWRGDTSAEREARQRLPGGAQEGEGGRRAGAGERIRRARLPVQDTMMVTPNEPSARGAWFVRCNHHRVLYRKTGTANPLAGAGAPAPLPLLRAPREPLSRFALCRRVAPPDRVAERLQRRAALDGDRVEPRPRAPAVERRVAPRPPHLGRGRGVRTAVGGQA